MTEICVILGPCMTPRCPLPEHFQDLRLSEVYRLETQTGGFCIKKEWPDSSKHVEKVLASLCDYS